MADKDISLKQLEAYPKVFADIVNVLMFKGKKVVDPADLEEANIKSQYKFESKLHEEERDVAKFCRDGNIRICLMGLENQTNVDKDMPLRVLAYDGAMYRAQLLDKKEPNRYPVITIVLYFGEGRWKAPKRLKQCLDIAKDFEPFVNDYKIYVFEIAHLPKKTIDMFESDFKIVAEYYWLKRQKKDFRGTDRQIEYADAFFKTMSALTGDIRYLQIQQDREMQKKIAQGGITVCEMLDKLEKKGETKGLSEAVKKIMKKLSMSQDAAMEFLEISPVDRPAILAAL